MLPLTPGAKLALIGKQAKQPTVHGGGSGSVVPYYTSAPFAAIAAAVGRGGGSVTYDDGSDLARAAALAARADVALVFAASDSSEGADRRSLSLDDGADALITAVAAANPKTVVAAVAPGAVLTPWRDAVAATTLAFMPGQEYGHALADILFGAPPPLTLTLTPTPTLTLTLTLTLTPTSSARPRR